MRTVILYFLFSSLGFQSFAQDHKEIKRMALNNELPIDTSYLPIDRFKYRFMDKKLTDSISAFFFIRYLKALDEPPIYCCESDSIIRVLTIPHYGPAVVSKIHNRHENFVIEQKTANKNDFDTSHHDLTQLDPKDVRKWIAVYHSGP